MTIIREDARPVRHCPHLRCFLVELDRARALAMTGSLIGAAAYGVALPDHGVADTVLASVLLGVSPSSRR